MFLLLLVLFQDQVDAAVKQLLALKAEYKQNTGKDYKPGLQAPACPAQTQTQASSASTQSNSSPQAQELFSQVSQQGDLVRKLKSEKAPKVRTYRLVLNTTKIAQRNNINNHISFLGPGGRSCEDSTGPEEQVQDSHWTRLQTGGCCWRYRRRRQKPQGEGEQV